MKKKSMDRKLLSKEKHEIAYVRKLSRTLLKEAEAKHQIWIHMTRDEVLRICNAVLKFAKFTKVQPRIYAKVGQKR